MSRTNRAEPPKLLRRAGAVICVAALTACSSAPVPTTYDLSAPSSRFRGAVGAQVLVAEPAAVQVLASQQLLVKDDGGTVSFLGAAQWADNLPRLVQARLIHTFENASLLRAVARPGSAAVADVQLTSEIRSFEVRTPENEAVVQISAKLVADQSGRILRGRIFTARVPVAAIDAPNTARALDEALSTVMIDMVRWVSSAPLPARQEESPAS